VGSPAEVPARGCPYAKVMRHLFASNDYYAIADSFSNNYTDNGDTLPMSVVRTDRLVQLAQSTREALQTLDSYPVEFSLDGLPYYCIDPIKRNVQYDMDGIMRRNCDSATYAKWKQAFQEAVPHKRGTRRWLSSYGVAYRTFTDFANDYGGISMYAPSTYYDSDSTLYQYNELIKRYDWYDAVGWSSFGW